MRVRAHFGGRNWPSVRVLEIQREIVQARGLLLRYRESL
jgi:hypothetical protein